MAAAASEWHLYMQTVPETPGGGPALDLEPQCSTPQPNSECGTTFDITALQVVATLGQETVTIGFGQTAAVGAFQVTNGFGFQVLSNSGFCDPDFRYTLTVLGPSAP